MDRRCPLSILFGVLVLCELLETGGRMSMHAYYNWRVNRADCERVEM